MTTTEFKPKQRADRDVTTFAEFSGLRNDTPPERMDASDLVMADNVVIDADRRVTRRAGATLIKAGATHSLWCSHDDAFVGQGAQLLRLASNMTTTPLASNLAGTALSFARAGDNVYFANGVTRGVALAATTRTWGLDVPPVSLLGRGGDLAAGRYLVSATYVRSDGQESGAEGADVIDVPAAGGIAVLVPASLDAGVTRTRVYISPPNEEVLYLVADLATNGGTFIPTAAQIAAGDVPLETQFMGPPPVGNLIAYYKGRLFVAALDTLYMSEPYNYELFDQRNYIQLDAPITMLAPMEDAGGASGFFIGTTYSTGVLLGDSPDDFKYAKRLDYGVVRGAVAHIEGTLFMEGSTSARYLPTWLSRAGICVGMPGLDVMNLTREKYEFPVGSGAGGATYDPVSNQFVATWGTGSAIVMNSRVVALTTFSNFAYTCFMRAFGRNFAGGAAGFVELVGDTDLGAPINAAVLTSTTDFGSSFMKALDRVYVGYRSTGAMAVTAVADDSQAVIYPLPAGDAGLGTQRVKVGKGHIGRYWQFKLTNIAGQDFSLDTIDAKSARLERRINGRA